MVIRDRFIINKQQHRIKKTRAPSKPVLTLPLVYLGYVHTIFNLLYVDL